MLTKRTAAAAPITLTPSITFALLTGQQCTAWLPGWVALVYLIDDAGGDLRAALMPA